MSGREPSESLLSSVVANAARCATALAAAPVAGAEVAVVAGCVAGARGAAWGADAAASAGVVDEWGRWDWAAGAEVMSVGVAAGVAPVRTGVCCGACAWGAKAADVAAWC